MRHFVAFFVYIQMKLTQFNSNYLITNRKCSDKIKFEFEIKVALMKRKYAINFHCYNNWIFIDLFEISIYGFKVLFLFILRQLLLKLSQVEFRTYLRKLCIRIRVDQNQRKKSCMHLRIYSKGPKKLFWAILKLSQTYKNCLVHFRLWNQSVKIILLRGLSTLVWKYFFLNIFFLQKKSRYSGMFCSC